MKGRGNPSSIKTGTGVGQVFAITLHYILAVDLLIKFYNCSILHLLLKLLVFIFTRLLIRFLEPLDPFVVPMY